MKAEKIDIYEACDKAIKAMNRENLAEFGKLKLAKWDELNVVRTVTALYRKSRKRARRRYYEVAFEAYLLGMAMIGIDPKKAQKKAEQAITNDWIDRILSETDFVTLYRFDTETERKAQRLVEALSATENRDYEIDKALKLWSKQLGQYAINITDYAIVQAFDDAGVEKVRWITRADERVCEECGPLHNRVFKIDEVPPKPHWGCRCVLIPVRS